MGRGVGRWVGMFALANVAPEAYRWEFATLGENMRVVIAVTTAAIMLAGCSSGGESMKPEREASVSSAVQDMGGSADDQAQAVEAAQDVPDCADLLNPVDRSVLKTGCFEGDRIVFGATFECEDGGLVVIAGDHRAGLEGGEWVDTDPDAGPFPWDLCPGGI